MGVKNYRYRYFFYGLGYFIAFFGILLIVASRGWTGEFDPCVANDKCFCEPIQYNALFVQPNNTWTNLFIVIGGLMVLYLIGQNKDSHNSEIIEKSDQTSSQYETVPEKIQLFYGFLAITIGLTSMFFHASMRWWADFLDLTSMNIYVSMLILYDIKVLRQWTIKQYFLILFLVNIILAIVLQLNAEFGVMLFTILVAFVFCLECGILISIHKVPSMKRLYRNWRWFALGMFLFTFGTFIWIFSNTGMPLCSPNSLWQGHGFWHFFDGVAIFLFYLYFRTEKITLNPSNS